jgi:hypothetical protein
VSLAIFFHYIDQLFLVAIALAALPETEGPLWWYRSLAGQFSIACNYFVGVVALDELIIDVVTGLRPE